jgi:hypothetical protein
MLQIRESINHLLAGLLHSGETTFQRFDAKSIHFGADVTIELEDGSRIVGMVVECGRRHIVIHTDYGTAFTIYAHGQFGNPYVQELDQNVESIEADGITIW